MNVHPRASRLAPAYLSEIEGEHLDPEQVRSSIARRLGIDIGALKPADRNVEGVVEMMLDATGPDECWISDCHASLLSVRPSTEESNRTS